MRPLAPFLLAVALALAGCTTVDGQAGAPVATEATAQLDLLTVARPRPMAGYARSRFPHWRQVEADGECDVRDVVLMRDGTGVTKTKACRITAGRWVSVYDGKTVTDPELIDIDHVVPLAAAWRSGADTWTDQQRADFANDLTRPQLIAVTRASNRAKGDQDPAEWKPPNEGHWCVYAQRWIAVKHHWSLTLTEAEKSALREMLGRCRAQSSGAQGSGAPSLGAPGSGAPSR